MKNSKVYTIFVNHSIYWKSFKTKKDAQKEISKLKKDNVHGIRLNKEVDD